MDELYEYLVACDYPPAIVRKGIHNARLQGPGPDPSKKLQTIPQQLNSMIGKDFSRLANTLGEEFVSVEKINMSLFLYMFLI